MQGYSSLMDFSSFSLPKLTPQRSSLFHTQLPTPVKRGGLNGSMQHLLKVFSYEPTRPISFAVVNSNKTKALFRF
jgi:hypothetical protein